MQFQVPQFIETEAKIVGPFTLKQFIYIAVAAVISFICFFVFTFILWIIITIVLGMTAVILAFAKFNGQPIPKIIVYAIRYLLQPHLYLWQRVPGRQAQTPKPPRAQKLKPQNPLQNLWLSMQTTTHPIHEREKPSRAFPFTRGRAPLERFETFRRASGEREAARRIDYR